MEKIKADAVFIQGMFKEEEFKKYFFGIEDSRKEEVSQECLDDCLKGGDSYSMIVDKDTDERVGIGCLNKYNGRYYFAVSIEKNKRRQGYATAVVKKYIEDIKNIKSGRKSVEAWAMSENPAMQTLLERLNFVEKEVTDYDKAPKHKHFVFCG